MTSKTVWIINPYGSLPSESWTTYRSTMLAECLAGHGYQVTQFISNFEHRSKTFRTRGHEVLTVNANYVIHVVPSSGYDSHISIQRVRYERTFAKHLLKVVDPDASPDFVVLAEPSLFYYNILLGPLIIRGKSILVLDIIDIWPELFELVVPKRIRILSRVLLAPLYYWRKRLYRYPRAIVAVADDYLNLAKQLTRRPDVIFQTVYWSYDSKTIDVRSGHNGGMLEFVRRKKDGEVWIVYAGTLGENYDIGSIIDVANQLTEDLEGRAQFKFIIAGDGPLKTLCEESSTENVVFLGRLGAAELRLLYPECDVALSTYKGESTVAMPIKAFDYLHYGLPIVNSLERDMGAFVRNTHVGINYDPRSPSSLYQAIRQLILDDELRRSCSINARILAQEFGSDTQYRKFVNVLERL
jgi:glycosyltransferase involved in cell wall biosynthesis